QTALPQQCVGGVAGMVLQRLGVVPQQIAAGDIYPALEKGAIDAAEWIGPYDDEKLGFVKVAKYYYTPGWWEPNSMGHVIVNLKAWELLPKEYQAAFATACGETNAIAMAKYDAVNPGGMRKLVSQGAQLRAFPKPVLTACYKASKEQWADWSSKYPEFKTLYESYSKFAESQHAWFKVAEQSFDNFMSNPN
ncbi:MAG: ABC transporter substrate-binding protein, partial [Betaproteobacteria bacterium]|nr:ABC transporter substrate-binding protein [Betaproteobacteria bacterium]